jgi:hypothetical protein
VRGRPGGRCGAGQHEKTRVGGSWSRRARLRYPSDPIHHGPSDGAIGLGMGEGWRGKVLEPLGHRSDWQAPPLRPLPKSQGSPGDRSTTRHGRRATCLWPPREESCAASRFREMHHGPASAVIERTTYKAAQPTLQRVGTGERRGKASAMPCCFVLIILPSAATGQGQVKPKPRHTKLKPARTEGKRQKPQKPQKPQKSQSNSSREASRRKRATNAERDGGGGEVGKVRRGREHSNVLCRLILRVRAGWGGGFVGQRADHYL